MLAVSYVPLMVEDKLGCHLQLRRGRGRCLYAFSGEHPGYIFRLIAVWKFSTVSAAFMGVMGSIFAGVGGFNEVEYTGAFIDLVFLKAQVLGCRNLWTRSAE